MTVRKSWVWIGVAVLILLGVGVSLFFVVPAVEVLRARWWDEVPCTILYSDVATHGGENGNTYSVVVRYAYDVGGRRYESTRYHFMYGSSVGRESKETIVRSIPRGSHTVCYVNPSDPGDAVLNRSLTPEYAYGLVPAAVVGVGVVAVARLRTRVRAARKSGEVSAGPIVPPVSDRQGIVVGSRVGTGIMVAWALVFFLAGGAILWFSYLPLVKLSMRARAWVETPCTIVSSGVDPRPGQGSEGMSYKERVVYRYRFAGRDYQSGRYQFRNSWSSSSEVVAAVVAGFRPRAHVTCYVDPDNPAEAVLVRSSVKDIVLDGVVPLSFLFIGVAGLGVIAWARGRPRRWHQRKLADDARVGE